MNIILAILCIFLFVTVGLQIIGWVFETIGEIFGSNNSNMTGQKNEINVQSSDYVIEPPINSEPLDTSDWIAKQNITDSYVNINISSQHQSSGVNLNWLNKDISFLNHGFKKECEYYSLYDYYPKNKYSNAPSEVVNHRNMMYEFKEGKSSIKVANLISSVLYNKLHGTKWIENDCVLMIIPASSNINSELRFKEFCEKVTNNLCITNGYEDIKRAVDRKKMHDLGHNISRVRGLDFNIAQIKDKNIILFDDLTTQGKSLSEIKEKLIKLGALDVLGVFLAESYDSFKKGYPDWYCEI